jgi:DNA-binding XRE family transcriptional regulator
MNSDSLSKRQILRCPQCELIQFETATGICRRCHRLLDGPTADLRNQPLLPSDSCLTAEALAKRIGGEIRSLRKDRRLSQERIANKMAISRSAVSKLESGKSVPSLAKLHRVTSALGIDIAEVFLRIR